jgi:hypothetical protein
LTVSQSPDPVGVRPPVWYFSGSTLPAPAGGSAPTGTIS